MQPGEVKFPPFWARWKPWPGLVAKVRDREWLDALGEAISDLGAGWNYCGLVSVHEERFAAPTLNATNAIREGRTRLNNQAAPQS